MSNLLPLYPSRTDGSTSTTAADLKINVSAQHIKLVKAEFVGCLLRG